MINHPMPFFVSTLYINSLWSLQWIQVCLYGNYFCCSCCCRQFQFNRKFRSVVLFRASWARENYCDRSKKFTSISIYRATQSNGASVTLRYTRQYTHRFVTALQFKCQIPSSFYTTVNCLELELRVRKGIGKNFQEFFFLFNSVKFVMVCRLCNMNSIKDGWTYAMPRNMYYLFVMACSEKLINKCHKCKCGFWFSHSFGHMCNLSKFHVVQLLFESLNIDLAKIRLKDCCPLENEFSNYLIICIFEGNLIYFLRTFEIFQTPVGLQTPVSVWCEERDHFSRSSQMILKINTIYASTINRQFSAHAVDDAMIHCPPKKTNSGHNRLKCIKMVNAL